MDGAALVNEQGELLGITVDAREAVNAKAIKDVCGANLNVDIPDTGLNPPLGANDAPLDYSAYTISCVKTVTGPVFKDLRPQS